MNLSKFLHFSPAEQSICVLSTDKQQLGNSLSVNHHSTIVWIWEWRELQSCCCLEAGCGMDS